ncbi:MAG: FIST N-terminal domain-containing protein [Bacteroidales bacterium]
MVFEIGIGTSQNWDAELAVSDALQDAKSKLTNEPTFILLFCTIHYAKNNGLKKILNTTYKHITEQTKLLGGTVAGFITNSGCYSRGLTVMACYSDEIEIKTGIGKNTKSTPKRATLDALNQVSLKNKSNELIFSIISGGKIPYIPVFKQGRVIPSKILGNITCKLFPYFGLFKKGVAKEDEILETITTNFPEVNLFSISTMDEEKMEINYQFYGKEVVTDCITILKIESNFKTTLLTEHGLEPVKEVEITKIGKENQIIYEINNQPARIGFLNIMDWPKEYLTERIYDKVFFYPLGFFKNNFYFPFIPGLFLGDSIVATYKIPNNKIYVLASSGSRLLKAVENSIIPINPKFILMSECGLRLQALGKQAFKEKDLLDSKFKDMPYLSLYVGGEATYTKKNGLRYGNSTFNLWSYEL